MCMETFRRSRSWQRRYTNPLLIVAACNSYLLLPIISKIFHFCMNLGPLLVLGNQPSLITSLWVNNFGFKSNKYLSACLFVKSTYANNVPLLIHIQRNQVLLSAKAKCLPSKNQLKVSKIISRVLRFVVFINAIAQFLQLR